MYYTDILKNLRTDNDLTQSNVASIIGVAQRTYADYELGNVRIPVDSLVALAKYYEVDMNYICGITSTKCKFPK